VNGKGICIQQMDKVNRDGAEDGGGTLGIRYTNNDAVQYFE
jgi:hypothetical protein